MINASECCPDTESSDCTDPSRPVCQDNQCVPKPGTCQSDQEVRVIK